MRIELCKKSLERLGDGAHELLDALSEREHAVSVKDCLNRCQGCNLGLVIAAADGAPMSARTAEAFLADLDEASAQDA
jgi:uncharacterized protein YuzB (UPF0349 family)